MSRISLRFALFSLVALAMAAPAFAYNVVNTSWTVNCIFSPSCSVTVTDYVAEFPVSGGSGNGRLQSRIFQSQDGRWVYEYRINLTYVAGITYIPYADQLAIYQWGTLQQYDFNSDSVSTDQVFNVTSGGVGTKAVTSAWLSGSFSYFDLNNPVGARQLHRRRREQLLLRDGLDAGAGAAHGVGASRQRMGLDAGIRAAALVRKRAPHPPATRAHRAGRTRMRGAPVRTLADSRSRAARHTPR